MAASYVIKAEIADREAARFEFRAVKTMYGGKSAAAGDTVFLFSSGNAPGRGLFARATVQRVDAVPKLPGIERQTPRISLLVATTGRSTQPFGRRELVSFSDWQDGRPETELNFKLYRQTTDKLVGVSAETAAFLAGFFA